jgi:hypothetical protein
MFVSILRPTRAWWLTMVILGQTEPSRHGRWTPVSRGISASGERCSDLVTAQDLGPVYVPAFYASSDDEELPPEKLPPAIASEIRSIEAIRRSIMAGGPIEQWQFETVRARYQALLKTGASDPAIEEAIRVCLARVTRHEQAAKAARTIQAILAESHRRDREVAELESRLRSATAGRSRSRAYQAVGFMQPSAQKVEGRKVFVLIGKNGATVAFLDIPPGLDPDPLLARRVGVRGVAHYNEELHSRLITVRDLEAIAPRR